MNYRILTSLMICFGCLVAPTSWAVQIANHIVAQVDDLVITESDLQESANQALDLVEKPVGQLTSSQRRNLLISQLVNEKILEKEIERQKIEVTETEVDQAVNQAVARRQTTKEKMLQELTAQGITLANFRLNLKEELKRNKFFQNVIYPKLYVSDYELEAYYRDHAKDFIGYDKIHFLEIFLVPDSFPGQNPGEAYKKIFTSLQAGANFIELAKKYSQGPFASQNGDSGIMDAKSLRPELLAILINAKIGELTPFPTANNGLFIFKVLERTNPKPRPLQEIKEQVRNQMMSEKMDDELIKYLTEAQSKHYVQINS